MPCCEPLILDPGLVTLRCVLLDHPRRRRLKQAKAAPTRSPSRPSTTATARSASNAVLSAFDVGSEVAHLEVCAARSTEPTEETEETGNNEPWKLTHASKMPGVTDGLWRWV